EAKLVHMDAEVLRLAGIVAHGLEMQPEWRMHDPPHHERGNDQEGEAIIVEWPSQKLDLVVVREFETDDVHARDAHAAVATREVIELEQKRVEQHAEGKRQHAEEDADVAHAQKPDRNGRERGKQHDREQDGLERLDAKGAGEHGGAISTEAEKHGMAERQQAGIAEEQIEPEQRDGVAEEGNHQGRVIGRRQERQQCQGGRSRQYDDHGRCAPHVTARPNRPAGRSSSTAIASTRALAITRVAGAGAEGRRTMAGARRTQTISAPGRPPRTDPTPPITTTANASMTKSIAMSRDAAAVGTISAPAVVPSTAPMV